MLDGYAGTGALGIEALSRGAAHVTFVERDRRAQTLIAENLAHCGIENGYAIIRAGRAAGARDAPRSSRRAPFDLVLLDPPYTDAPDAALAAAADLVAPDGLLVLEHARRRRRPMPPARWCGRAR